LLAKGIPHYIIDGYNVIFSNGFSSKRVEVNDSREKLIILLDSYAAKKRVELTVVWDGGEPAGLAKRGARRVKSIYSRGEKNADERIIRMVENARQRGRITVVSDDRRHITGVVKSLGAKAMGTREFLSLIRYTPSRIKRKVSEGKEEDETKEMIDDLSVEDWMRIFRSRGRKE
jgi:predicted RNA-binding protein with PIN domain